MINVADGERDDCGCSADCCVEKWRYPKWYCEAIFSTELCHGPIDGRQEPETTMTMRMETVTTSSSTPASTTWSPITEVTTTMTTTTSQQCGVSWPLAMTHIWVSHNSALSL